MHIHDLHTIDEYLLGRLDVEALKAFELKLGQDASLAELVNERKLLMQQVEAYGELRLKERIQKATGDGLQSLKSRIKPFYWVLACMVLALLGLVIWQFTKKVPVEQPKQLYADYFEPYPLSFGNRGENMDKQLADAGQLYRSGNYQQALPIFESVLSMQQDKQDGLILAIGICQLELNQPDLASQSLEKILLNPNSPYKSQAQWYLALAYLNRDDVAASKKMLMQIVKSKNEKYASKAGELLSKIGE